MKYLLTLTLVLALVACGGGYTEEDLDRARDEGREEAVEGEVEEISDEIGDDFEEELEDTDVDGAAFFEVVWRMSWDDIPQEDRENICTYYDLAPRLAVSDLEDRLGDQEGFDRDLVHDLLDESCEN